MQPHRRVAAKTGRERADSCHVRLWHVEAVVGDGVPRPLLVGQVRVGEEGEDEARVAACEARERGRAGKSA